MTEIKEQYEAIINRLQSMKEENYSMKDIERLTNQILGVTSYYEYNGPTQIVRITEEFGIISYQKELENYVAGKLLINGNTENQYGINQVVLVNKRDGMFEKRIAVARGLAYFLLDYLGSEEEKKKTSILKDYYYKQELCYDEKRIFIFVTSILMPRELFIQEYWRAVKELNGNVMFIIRYLSEFFEVPAYIVLKYLRRAF